MNRQECEQLIAAYVDWLRKGLSVEKLDEACELTTPFLDRHNDHMQIYVRRDNGDYVLTDDGYILSDLKSCGCELDSTKRKELLVQALNGFGVQREDDACRPNICHGLCLA